MIEALTDAALLESIHLLVRRSGSIEAEVLGHLAEIDERKLYLSRAFPSLFAFCVEELGFSEDAAYNRIVVARAGRRCPALIDAVRSGALHLAGARLLAPHLSPENAGALLPEARGKSKRQLEELLAARFPRPAIPAEIRKLPQRSLPASSEPSGQPLFAVAPPPSAAAPRIPAQPMRAVQPLAEGCACVRRRQP